MRTALYTILFLSSLITLAIVHVCALYFSLYWRYLWLDIPVHILGGVVVSLGIFFAANVCAWKRVLATKIWFVLGGVLLVGIMWELYEVTIGVALLEENYMKDLLIDMSMDIVGGLIGYGIGKTVESE